MLTAESSRPGEGRPGLCGAGAEASRGRVTMTLSALKFPWRLIPLVLKIGPWHSGPFCPAQLLSISQQISSPWSGSSDVFMGQNAILSRGQAHEVVLGPGTTASSSLQSFS